MELTKGQMLDLYSTMLTMRRFEERAMHLFAHGSIPGFVHLYIGQEACAAGVCAALGRSDYVVSNHRGHGHCIAKGADLRKMMAEMMGRRTGYGGGKSGSMHICDPSVGMLGANGIVGAGLPIATGAAFSAQVRETGQVAVCFFGEGASSEGTFHESLNLAAIWRLPAIYACENNLYAEMTHQRVHVSVQNVADRAAAYGIPGVVVDGNDVVAVYQAACEAVRRGREGQGPTLLELKTFRWRGHYEGDPVAYRTRDEEEAWKERCPIASFRKKLFEQGVATEDEIAAVDARVEDSIEDAVRFALESPLPDPGDVLLGVYAESGVAR